MKMPRKWLNEFVDLSLEEYDDRTFAEAMTVSGSKVEVTEDLSETMKRSRSAKSSLLKSTPTPITCLSRR